MGKNFKNNLPLCTGNPALSLGGQIGSPAKMSSQRRKHKIMNANLKQIVGPGILEQEQTERTETREAKSFCPASIEIGRPFIRVMASFESALCPLCYLLFKPIWLRSSLCALCVLLW